MNLPKSCAAILVAASCLASGLATGESEVTTDLLRRWASHKEETEDLSDEDLLSLWQSDFDCFVVPHCHWDKEWFATFEQHHVRLVKLVDNTVAVLENDPEYRCFVLDGQSSLIKDYLDTRPEMRGRIEGLVRQGRLLVGPWYTQPDLLVVSGEQLVRNLVTGIRTAREVGGEMKCGYMADNFGMCAQLPQIFRGAGIERAAMYRGPNPSGPEYKNLFEWRALDGSSVIVAHLLGPTGYLMFTWPYDVPDMPESYLLRALHYLAPHNLTKAMLLPAGSDATEPHPSLPKVLQRLDEEFPNLSFRIASFNEYVDAALAEEPTLPVCQGTLRYPSRSCVGCISARLNQKRSNAEAYTVLENYAEPYSVLAWLLTGRRYPGTSLDKAWWYLLENMTHDDMAGFCCDPVHEVMDTRFIESTRLAETLAIRGMKTIFERIKTPDKSDLLHKPLVVFNPLPWQRTDLVETLVYVDARGRIDPPFQEGGYKSFEVHDSQGGLVPSTVFPEEGGRIRIRFIAENVPSLGYKTFLLVATKTEPNGGLVEEEIREIENEFLRLSFHEDGRFDLLDKETGLSYPGLHFFEDQTAKGSALTFSLSGKPTNTVGLKARIDRVEDGPAAKTVRVRWSNWRVPSNGAAGRPATEEVEMPITSFITLPTGVKRVDIYTEVDNRAFYHLLRAVFQVPVSVDRFSIGTQFGAQEVPVYDRENRPGGAWAHEIYPHLDWSDVSDGVQGLAVLDRGTPAVSAYPSGDGSTSIFLPVLRSCGSNGGDVQDSVPPNLFSSEERDRGAQLLGVQKLRCSLYPHQGDWRQAKVSQAAQNAACRLWAETISDNDMAKWQVGPYGFAPYYKYPEGDMPLQGSFLEITPDGAILSALKKGVDEDSIVARLYNTLPEEREFTLTFFQPAKAVTRVNLLEEPMEPCNHFRWQVTEDGKTEVRFALGAFEILSLAMTLEIPEGGLWQQTIY